MKFKKIVKESDEDVDYSMLDDVLSMAQDVVDELHRARFEIRKQAGGENYVSSKLEDFKNEYVQLNNKFGQFLNRVIDD